MTNSVVSTIRKDLTVGNGKNGGPTGDAAQSLALCSIANMSGLELIQALHADVQHVLVAKTSTPNVKKKAAYVLCLA
jgi:AP-2 complex subunit alpha